MSIKIVQKKIAIEWIDLIMKAQQLSSSKITGEQMFLERNRKKEITKLGACVISKSLISAYPGQLYIRPTVDLGSKIRKSPKALYFYNSVADIADDVLVSNPDFFAVVSEWQTRELSSPNLVPADKKEMYVDPNNLIYTASELYEVVGADEYDKLVFEYEELYSINIEVLDFEEDYKESLKIVGTIKKEIMPSEDFSD